jgi:hypothetical protein
MQIRRREPRKLIGAYYVADFADITFWWFGPIWTVIDEMLTRYLQNAGKVIIWKITNLSGIAPPAFISGRWLSRHSLCCTCTVNIAI